MRPFHELILMLVVLTDFWVLGTTRLSSMIRATAIQGVLLRYERLTAEMADFERVTLEDWCSSIATVSEQTLKQSLLRCDWHF